MGKKDNFALESKKSTKKSKMLQIKVTTMDAELEFAIQPNTTGKQLFDQVVKTIGLREIWFFGLQYQDVKGFTTWLKLNKKVTSQDMKKDPNDKMLYNFKFRAKFYPEDVSTELIQEITQKLFFLQVRDQVLSDDYYCPPETSVLLASYQVQAKFGPYMGEHHPTGYLSSERLLPERVIKQHRMNREEWEERISTWHKEHGSMPREEAIMEYLKISQDLEMYGVSYFEIMNKKKTELYLGVDALGLNIYEKKDRLTPKIGFPWSEIRNISFNDRKFVIKPIDRKAPDFQFYVERLRINKRILALCMGNHELYMRRRQPDPIEVQQMRQEANVRRAEAEIIRQRVEKEKKEREDAQKQQKALEEEKALLIARLQAAEDEKRAFQEASNNLKERLEEKNEVQNRMESQIKSIEDEKANIEALRREAEDEARKLAAKNTEDEVARYEMEQELKLKQEAIALMEASELEKAEEIARFQQEAREAEESFQMKKKELDEMAERQAQEAEEKAIREAEEREREMELLRTQMARDRDEESRQTEAARNKELQDQLKELKNQLGDLKDTNETTAMDLIHADNVKQGRDKYKTLKQIRRGNTKQRVDQFECM